MDDLKSKISYIPPDITDLETYLSKFDSVFFVVMGLFLNVFLLSFLVTYTYLYNRKR